MGSEGQRELGGVCPQEGGKDGTEEGARSAGTDGDAWSRREDYHILTSSLMEWHLAAEFQLQGLWSEPALGWAGCSTQGTGLPSEE